MRCGAVASRAYGGKRGFVFNERNISSLFANGNDPEERAKLTVWERKE